MKELLASITKCEIMRRHNIAFLKILKYKEKIKTEMKEMFKKIKTDLGTETNKHVVEMYSEEVCHAFVHDLIAEYFRMLLLGKPGDYEEIFNILYETIEL